MTTPASHLLEAGTGHGVRTILLLVPLLALLPIADLGRDLMVVPVYPRDASDGLRANPDTISGMSTFGTPT